MSKQKIDFTKFWEIYPRRDKKIPARKKWDALSLEKQKKAIAHLKLNPFINDNINYWSYIL